jgi:hypothetical protein
MPVGGCAYWWESHYSLVQGHSPLKPFAVLLIEIYPIRKNDTIKKITENTFPRINFANP